MSDDAVLHVPTRKSVYQILREWDSDSNSSDLPCALTDSDPDRTLPPSQSPVFVLASCSDASTNSSMIANVSDATFSDFSE